MTKSLTSLYEQKLAAGAIQPDFSQHRAIKRLQQILDELGTAKPGLFRRKAKHVRGLYMHGGVGRGKTMLMDMFHDSLPSQIKKRRVHFHEFMIGVHDHLHKARLEGHADTALMRYAREVADKSRVLCFDEFHVTDIADAMILSRLFTALFEYGVTVVATSNVAPDRLYEGGLQRDRFLPFIDVLKNNAEIMEMDGGIDYRLRTLRDSGVYFHPLNAQSAARADEIFRRLTEGTTPGPETLEVKGRTLRVPLAARGVARFSFADLCEKPLGAEDYLGIANAYHTVFIGGIPVLPAEKRNEAKRLILLIDVLYDHGINAVITAAALPQDLYASQDHGFEFQRTASRLIEMQSSDYISRHAG